MLRTIETSVISKAIEEMCIEANHFLSEDMKECLGCAAETEKSPLAVRFSISFRKIFRLQEMR